MSRPPQERQPDFFVRCVKASIEPRTKECVASREAQPQQRMRGANQLQPSRRCAIEIDEIGQSSVGKLDRAEGNRIEFENYQVPKLVFEISELDTRSTIRKLLRDTRIKTSRALGIQ